MVKTFELDPASDIWIVQDLERRTNAGSGEESTEEYGVRVCRQHRPPLPRHTNRSVGLITFGKDLRVTEPERGPQQLTRVLENLATVAAVGDAPLGNLLHGRAAPFWPPYDAHHCHRRQPTTTGSRRCSRSPSAACASPSCSSTRARFGGEPFAAPHLRTADSQRHHDVRGPQGRRPHARAEPNRQGVSRMAGMNLPMQRSMSRRMSDAAVRGPRFVMSWEDWLTLAAALICFVTIAVSIQQARVGHEHAGGRAQPPWWASSSACSPRASGSRRSSSHPIRDRDRRSSWSSIPPSSSRMG